MSEAPLDDLRVDGVDESLALIRSVLADNPGAALDIVCLNAGAAIYVSGCADTHQAGVEAARAAIANGKAAEVLQNLVAKSNA
jgi:anthranilate phosphoribosyltransferase